MTQPCLLPPLGRVHKADALAGLRSLPAGSVQCIVTSPPYWGLRDYGEAGQIGLEPTPEEYVARMVEVFREVRRVLRDDGTLWLNLGDSYAGGGRGDGSKDCKQKTNIGSLGFAPQKAPPGLKPKDLVGAPWRVAFALQADGWYLRSEIIWAKPNPMPESVTDRPTKSHEQVFMLTKARSYYYDAEAVKEPCESGPSDIRKMVESLPRIGGKHKDLIDPLSKASSATNIGRKRAVGSPDGRNCRSVWAIPTQPYPGAHFATFPELLPERCIRAGSKPGDLVCDPFAGSGTAGVVAVRLGRRFIGFDLAGGDKDLGGHTANERIANPFLSLAEIATGQMSISGGGAVIYVVWRLEALRPMQAQDGVRGVPAGPALAEDGAALRAVRGGAVPDPGQGGPAHLGVALRGHGRFSLHTQYAATSGTKPMKPGKIPLAQAATTRADRGESADV